MEISCIPLPALGQISGSQAVPQCRPTQAWQGGMGIQGWVDGSLTLVIRCELQQMPSFSRWFPYLNDELVTSPQVSA